MTIYAAPTPEIADTMRATPAEWLSVRNVIRSAGDFAISRQGGDNALSAYLTGLDTIGITIPEPAAEATRYEQSQEIRTAYYVTPGTLPDGTVATADRMSHEWMQLRRQGIRNIDSVRRVHTLLSASGYRSTESYGGYLERDYGTDRLYVTIQHTFSRTHVTEEPHAEVNAAWVAQTERQSATLDRMIRAEMSARGIATEPWGEPNRYAYSEPMRRTQRISARVADAVRNADALAPANSFIRTDDFLAMMRDQAVENHWCGEHHAIIARLTQHTREPLGYRAQVSINVQQEFQIEVNSFYGSEATPQAIEERLNDAARRLVNSANDHYAGAEWFADMRDYTVTVEPFDAIESEWSIAPDMLTASDRMTTDYAPLLALAADQDDDQDDHQEYCNECDEYHDA